MNQGPLLRLPEALSPLIERVRALAASQGLDAYVVGGSVRDVLLGRPMRDLDLVVDREALALTRAIADGCGGHFVVLDAGRSVGRAVIEGAAVRYVDVATLHGSLEHDLRRRDLTVDAMAAPLAGGAVIDVSGGLADLAASLVRMTSPRAFDDDPLRLLRATRLASELGFVIEPATAEAIRARAGRANEPAPERRRDELMRIFSLDDSLGALRLVDALGLLDILLPEVAAGRGVEQPREHAFNVLEHSLRTVGTLDVMLGPRAPSATTPAPWGEGDGSVSPPELWRTLWREFGWQEESIRAQLGSGTAEDRSYGALLKFAALLHDVAKPQTRSVDADGRVRFLGHADAGAATAATVARRYRLSSRETHWLATLVREHLRPVQLAAIGAVPTRRALYRFHRDLGDAAIAVLLLSLADAAAARGPGLTPAGWLRHVRYMNSVLVRSREDEGILHPPRLLTGCDIMSEFGLPEGPRIGRLLGALAEAQGAGEVTDRGGALAFVRALAQDEEDGNGH